MSRATDSLIVAGFAFLGGYLAGIVSAPRSGADSRKRMAASARQSGQWIEDHMRDIESQLQDLEDAIADSRRNLGDRVKSAAAKAVDHYVPSPSDAADGWKVADQEIARDLPKMPKR